MVDFNKLNKLNKEINNMNDTNQSVFDSGELDEQESEYLKFDTANNNTVKYTMLQEEPDKTKNKFDKDQYTFEVLNRDTKTIMNHSITSKRYMRGLAEHRPLEGKGFCVQRKGEGMETDYHVVLIE